MTSILSCPPEIWLQVLRQFDSFADVTALAATCKRLNNLWQTAAPTIIWAIAPKRIPAFDDALMAVRATNLVKPAFESGHIPPDVGPLENLSGASTRPNLSELVQVTNLQHLVRCLQYMFFHAEDSDNGKSRWTTHVSALAGERRVKCCYTHEDTGDAIVERWEENFSRATYRLFLVAAVLARAYHERFFLEHEQRSSHTTAVYEFRVDAENDAATFGPLCTWILKTARAEAVRRQFVPFWKEGKERRATRLQDGRDIACKYDACDYYSEEPDEEEEEESEYEDTPDEDIFAMRELMAMLAAYEITRIRFFDSLNKNEYEPKVLPYPTPLPEKGTDQTRKVSVIMFGSFRLEEVTMPVVVQDTKNTLLASRRIVPSKQLPVQASGSTRRIRSPYSWSVRWQLGAAGEDNPETNSRGWPGPELALKLLSYIHKTTWNQMISPGDPNWLNSTYRDFIADGVVFFDHRCLINYGIYYLERCQ